MAGKDYSEQQCSADRHASHQLRAFPLNSIGVTSRLHQLRPEPTLSGVNEVESRTGAVALASRWLLGWAFAALASIRFGLALFPVPAHRTGQASYRIRLSEKTHASLKKRVTPSATAEHNPGWLDSSSIPMSFVASCVRL